MIIRKRFPNTPPGARKGSFPLLLGLLLLTAVSMTACKNTQDGQMDRETAALQSPKAETEFQALEIGGTDSESIPKDAEGAGAITGAAQADGEELTGIAIDSEKAEAVSIYYGSICYSFFSEDREAIDQVAELFTGFSLEEVPEGELDADTTYQIYFSTDTEQVAAVNVDKNGMFYLPEEKKFYKVKAGVFHFETLDQIYRESMNADGFDENQCLIR